jgi:CubicO group peptidase (beta-lactamase class C family)
MAEIVNLRRAKRVKARAEADAQAAENRILFGRTKAEKERTEMLREKARREIDGHRREDGLSMAAAARADAWPMSSPEAAGFATDLGEKLDAGVRSGLLKGLHAVLVARRGEIVLERYWEGPDEAWGRPLGHVAFGPETLHDLRSVTKSIVALLYGMAIARRLVPPPQAPLLAQFPEHPDLAADPTRQRLTVEHALTMTLGIDWNESIPYTDPANAEIAMETAPDRFRFILERPMLREPGTRWSYCGGATALLGRLIEKGSGVPLPEFARKSLFEPLGIERFEWAAGADGVHSAASGLRLTARDLAKIGGFVIEGGEWQGREIVSGDWIVSMLAPSITTGDGLDYGRHWFLGADRAPAFGGAPKPWTGAFGNGGQRLLLMAPADLSMVVFAGHYNAPDAWVGPMRVWREIVLANLLHA